MNTNNLNTQTTQKPTNISLILYDLDGTLADTALDLGGAINQMRQSRGLPKLSMDVLRVMASSGSRGLLQVGFNMSPSHPYFQYYQEEFLNIYAENLAAETVLFDDVADVIKTLAANGIGWGVVTNKPKRFTDPLMQALIQRYDLPAAATIVSGDTCKHAKPFPEPILYGLAEAGISATNTLYVGDDLRDIQAAKAAGVQSVAALYGYLGEHQPNTWGADFDLHQFKDLLALCSL